MKKILSLCLFLVLALCLTVPAFAGGQEPLINGVPYEKLLGGLLQQTEDDVTIQLNSDFQLTGFSVVLGSSDYNGLFGGEEMVVPCHNITLDLNGYTLTGEKNFPVFEVQEGYSLTVIDSSEDMSGRMVADGMPAVFVDSGEYTYAAKQEVIINDVSYEKLLGALLQQSEDEVTVQLNSDFQLTGFPVILGSSDYSGLFGGEEMVVPCHNITLDLNGYTLIGEKDLPIFEIQEGYTLTVVDTSKSSSGAMISKGDVDVEVNGGVYNPLPEND